MSHKIICPICSGTGGAGGRCYKCDGSGWIDENEPLPQSPPLSPNMTMEQYLHLTTKTDSVTPNKSPKPKKHLVYCLSCQSYVREDRWDKHIQRAHPYSEIEPVFDDIQTMPHPKPTEPLSPSQQLSKKLNKCPSQKPLNKCPLCDSYVREDRLRKHIKKIHRKDTFFSELTDL